MLPPESPQWTLTPVSLRRTECHPIPEPKMGQGNEIVLGPFRSPSGPGGWGAAVADTHNRLEKGEVPEKK